MRFGFSTGSLALGDFRKGLKMAAAAGVAAVELSALRELELVPLLDSLDDLTDELSTFEYISFHAPSSRKHVSETDFVEMLASVALRGWAIVVHPDIIEDFSLWRRLGSAVCLENMDKRKSNGRTAAQFKSLFSLLPDARLCFDIGHAMQVDPTMLEADMFLRQFGDRITQVHMSYVNSQCRHERLNFESIDAFRSVASQIGPHIPVILETPVTDAGAREEVHIASMIWSTPSRIDRAFGSQPRWY